MLNILTSRIFYFNETGRTKPLIETFLRSFKLKSDLLNEKLKINKPENPVFSLKIIIYENEDDSLNYDLIFLKQPSSKILKTLISERNSNMLNCSDLEYIYNLKKGDFSFITEEQLKKMIEGTATSMGITFTK